MSLHGIVEVPTLDDVHLERSPHMTRVTMQDVKSIRQTIGGGRREQRSLYGIEAVLNPGHLLPTKKLKHVVQLDFQHLAEDLYSTLEELLAAPGVHSLSLWKPITLTYIGNGTDATFWSPWQLAIDFVSTAPTKSPAGAFNPVVKVGRGGPELTYVSKDAGAYAAGSPAADEVWFLEGGQVFKILTPPLTTETVYLRIVPVFSVFEVADSDREYRAAFPGREPRGVGLVER